jgi:hypothetical protein
MMSIPIIINENAKKISCFNRQAMIRRIYGGKTF